MSILIENKTLEATVLKDGDKKVDGGEKITRALKKLVALVKGGVNVYVTTIYSVKIALMHITGDVGLSL